MITSVRIVGAGLIGTSVALALKAEGVEVEVIDQDSAAQMLARDLVQATSIENPEVILLALPVSQIFEVLQAESSLYPNSILMDVGSTKSELQVKVDELSEVRQRFVGTHPKIGRAHV